MLGCFGTLSVYSTFQIGGDASGGPAVASIATQVTSFCQQDMRLHCIPNLASTMALRCRYLQATLLHILLVNALLTEAFPNTGVSSHASNTLEAKHFVLVHGAGHGAWCWYRIVDLLQRAGHKASAVDLASAGIDTTDPDTIDTAQQLTAPLISFLEALPDSEKVILVLHSMGGLSGSVAMEQLPGKIAASVFLAALMFPDPKDERAGEVFQLFEKRFAELLKATALTFGNGADQPPTSATLNKTGTPDVFYNLSPSKDVILASLCLKPFPLLKDLAEYFASQTADRYGSVPRFYIVGDHDRVNHPEMVHLMLEVLPPKQVLSIHADHSSFFSAPHQLVRHLLEIAEVPLMDSISQTILRSDSFA